MYQFQVPQFIEVEDKIFGPLTLKQFLYVLGGGSIIFLLYAFLPFFLMILLAAPVAVLFGALAFYKINGQPLVKILEGALEHYTKSRLFIWKKIERPQKTSSISGSTPNTPGLFLPKLTESKLKELAWSLDIQHGKRS